MKTALVQARIEPKVKSKVEKILSSLGLNSSEAINMFFHQVIAMRGIPFEIIERKPNARLRKSIASTEKGKKLKSFSNLEDLYRELNS